MQVAEVELLPEATAEAVADPAGDGQPPQSPHPPGQTQSLLVRTAAAQRGTSQWTTTGSETQNVNISSHRM